MSMLTFLNTIFNDLAVIGTAKKERREQTNKPIDKSTKEYNWKIRVASDLNYLPDMAYYFEMIYTACVIPLFTCTTSL